MRVQYPYFRISAWLRTRKEAEQMASSLKKVPHAIVMDPDKKKMRFAVFRSGVELSDSSHHVRNNERIKPNWTVDTSHPEMFPSDLVAAPRKAPGVVKAKAKNRCVYHAGIHSGYYRGENANNEKPCGKITARGGKDRFFCQRHLDVITAKDWL